MARGFINFPIVIVLLFLTLFVGLYIGKNGLSLKNNASTTTEKSVEQEDEIASWKTYTNKDYSFKYPGSWYTQNPNAGKGAWINFFRLGDEVRYTNNSKFGTEKLRLLLYDTTTFYNIDVIDGRTQTTIGGKQAITDPSAADILVKKLDDSHDLILHLEKWDNDKQSSKIFNKILSTLNFADQSIERKEGEDYIMFNGKKLTIVRVKEGYDCEGRVPSNGTVYYKCEEGLYCKGREGTIADASGVCTRR